MSAQYKTFEFLKIFSFFALCIISSALLIACSGGHSSGSWQNGHQSKSPAQQNPNLISDRANNRTLQNPATLADKSLPPVKVAILLPLSGANATLGQSMLNAAQIALFDVGYDNFELIPKDTKGTPEGARSAAREAVSENAGLVLGPLFSDSVRAARSVTASANINMIAFSTDWTLAGGNTYLMGFTPFDQIERVIGYSAANNINNIGVFAPDTKYGQTVVSAYKSFAPRYNIMTPKIKMFPSQSPNLDLAVKDFARMPMQSANDNMGSPYDAVLMPVDGQQALAISNLLTYNGLPPKTVRRLGTGLLDDPALLKERNLEGVWFAAPMPKLRDPFERKYIATYNTKPPRIATIAYDATALSAVLAARGFQESGRPAFDRASINNPNGFAGIDGIFRFRQNGTAERGLSILEIRNGRLNILDPAPQTFQRTSM